MGIERIAQYIESVLTEKTRGQPRKVVRLLNWDFGKTLEELTTLAFQTLCSYLVKNEDGSLPSTSLTSTSLSIAKIVESTVNAEFHWRDQLHIGDLFIEAFLAEGFITLDRLGKYGKGMDEDTNIVVATEKLLASLEIAEYRYSFRGTSLIKPTSVRGVQTIQFQENIPQRKPVVKGWTIEQHDMLGVMRDFPWVKAMDSLQQQPWSINTDVLDAVLQYKQTLIKDDRPKVAFSKKISYAFITEKAKQLRHETFYQYLDCDYRGRFYYIEPFFNFQGSDVARGLYLFANGKPMTESGKYWLAIHTACCFNQSYELQDIPEWCTEDYASHLREEGLDSISVDKMTLDDRVQWTNMNMEYIRNIAKFRHIDEDAEKPVSFLAACLEWEKIEQWESAGLTYISRLPIPIDGSNNGWQHLGAISKDPLTGSLVGLVPVTIQSDFYVQTAKQLIARTKDEKRAKILSDLPMKKIRKCISKRGSMTRAYSAGATKIAENMYEDCRDIRREYDITEKDCLGFARDLIKAIDVVCPGPLETMKYLQNLAIEELETTNHLTWSTPSGFPVSYTAYHTRKYKEKVTLKGCGNVRDFITHVYQEETTVPDKRKYMCGISPNFIHSMDASHMARLISKWNGSFGAVHDSFSTHACDVDDLVEQTKEEFIKMYDVDSFYDYIEDELLTNPSTVLRPILGSLNIKEIRNSDYFFA